MAPVDPPQVRRSELAQIHAMAHQLGMETGDSNPECEYRAMLKQHGGNTSAGHLSPAGRASVIKHLRARVGTGTMSQADYIRKLWGQVHAAGLVSDNSPKALDAFVYRMTRISAVRFLPASDANRVIEALKSMKARAQAQA